MIIVIIIIIIIINTNWGHQSTFGIHMVLLSKTVRTARCVLRVVMHFDWPNAGKKKHWLGIVQFWYRCHSLITRKCHTFLWRTPSVYSLNRPVVTCRLTRKTIMVYELYDDDDDDGKTLQKCHFCFAWGRQQVVQRAAFTVIMRDFAIKNIGFWTDSKSKNEANI